MGLEFIDRTLKTSGVVLLIFLPFGLFYYGVFPSLAIFSGGVWGMLNLIFISALVRETLQPGKVNTLRALGLALFKFPLLYVSLYFLLTAAVFNPLQVTIGLSGILAIILLKAVGRVFVQVGDRPDNSPGAERVA
jgi:hypothetical protein